MLMGRSENHEAVGGNGTQGRSQKNQCQTGGTSLP